ncbi:MAG: pyridoxamine 5'-phosphate oxidase family protein [Gammaproteobacteria bacterium]|nr:pyridoxamine 5'-phosphate oxidase family protein [Gammaproteobacteria bacterium]MYH33721.1 pyridoxamine 5'-phosphate oxidase family protein [Gammaproteobacteria bacterium]MYL00737.1 pyridoxamine 5'-phosphate oxidase family protein [Gammaproteobacteria bacterium]
MARLNALQSEDELRGYFPVSVERAKLKVLDGLDRHCIDFIARSPFLCIGTSRPDGCSDVSPRGDPPGFVHVADANTLLIPDRPGNNRLDTMSNIMHNPKVGLLFFIPGLGETLRVNGDARIIDGEAELARFEFRRHIPKVAIAVTVREAFIHCAKAIRRSRLWEEDAKIDPKSFTRIGDIISDHIKGRKSGDEIEEILKENYRTQMY